MSLYLHAPLVHPPPWFINQERLKSNTAQAPICFTSSVWLCYLSTELVMWWVEGQHQKAVIKAIKEIVVCLRRRETGFKWTFWCSAPWKGTEWLKSGTSIYSQWAVYMQTHLPFTSDYFSLFTYQRWNYLLPATQCVTERQRCRMCISVEIILPTKSKQVDIAHKHNWQSLSLMHHSLLSSSISLSASYCTYGVSLDSCSFSPSFHLLMLSPDIKSWLLHKCIHCFRL